MRLGKRERLAKRNFETAIRLRNAGFVSLNMSQPKPARSLLTRDETAALMYNSHTQGISIGQRETHFQKKGTFKKG
jgi:hypothetical protein